MPSKFERAGQVEPIDARGDVHLPHARAADVIPLGLDDPSLGHQRFDRLGELLAGNPYTVLLGPPALHGPDASGSQRRDQFAFSLPVADQDPPLLFVDNPPHGLLGGDRLAVVQEIDAAGQAIGIVAFRLVDHQASLRRQLDLLGTEIVRHVHFRAAGQLPEPPQQFPAVAVRHFHLGVFRRASIIHADPLASSGAMRSSGSTRPCLKIVRGACTGRVSSLVADDITGRSGSSTAAHHRTGCPDGTATAARRPRPAAEGRRTPAGDKCHFSTRASRCVAASLGRRNCCMFLGNSASETRDDE